MGVARWPLDVRGACPRVRLIRCDHLEEHVVRRTAELLFAMALLAVAAGCSSSGGAGGTSAASPTQMTGVRLKAALLPASDFPPGYSVLGEQDSGASLAGPRAGVDLNTMSCSYFVSHSTVALVGATAYAAEGLR